jgi:hypothetical protein
MYKTFVINLDRDTKKWASIQARASWPLVRFPATLGTAEPDRPFHMNAFMMGCLMSHRRLWQQISEQQEPCMIVEDDCVFCTDFENVVESYMSSVPTNFDIAVLGYIASDVTKDVLLAALAYPILKRRELRRVNEGWFVPGMFMGSHCYVLTPAGAKKLVNNHDIYHVDCVLNRDLSLRLYCPCQPLATQVIQGEIMYNKHVSWEWILAEPVFGLGPLTVRSVHLIGVYIGISVLLRRSKCRTRRKLEWVLQMIALLHYMHTQWYIEARL